MALNPGNCDTFPGIFNSSFFNVIPGNDIYVQKIGKWETFSFAGNLPGYSPYGQLAFSHLQLQGLSPIPQYSKTPAPTVFQITGNGNLCYLEGPSSFAIQLGLYAPPACINITPYYSTLDITQAFPFACGE